MDRRTFIKTTGATAAGTALTGVGTTATASTANKNGNWPIATPSGLLEPVILEAVQSIGATIEQITDSRITIDADDVTASRKPSTDQIFITRPDFNMEAHPELALLAVNLLTAPTKEDFASWLWLHGGASMLRTSGHLIDQELFCLTHTGYPGLLTFDAETPIPNDEITDPELLTTFDLDGVSKAIIAHLAGGRPSGTTPARQWLSKISHRLENHSENTRTLSNPFARNGTPLLIFIPSQLWQNLTANQQLAVETAIESAFAKTQAIIGGLERSINRTRETRLTALSLERLYDIDQAAKDIATQLAGKSHLASMIHDSLFQSHPRSKRKGADPA